MLQWARKRNFLGLVSLENDDLISDGQLLYEFWFVSHVTMLKFANSLGFVIIRVF